MAILPLLAATRLHLIIHNALLLIVTKMLSVEIIRNKRKQHEKKNRKTDKNFQLPTTDLGYKTFQFLTGYWKNLTTPKREYFFQE